MCARSLFESTLGSASGSPLEPELNANYLGSYQRICVPEFANGPFGDAAIDSRETCKCTNQGIQNHYGFTKKPQLLRFESAIPGERQRFWAVFSASSIEFRRALALLLIMSSKSGISLIAFARMLRDESSSGAT